MDKYPGYQNMISFDSPEVISARHADILAFREATDDDCRLVNLEAAKGIDKKQGFGCTYQLHWTTGKGWQVYMQHTGCYVANPQGTKDDVTTSVLEV